LTFPRLFLLDLVHFKTWTWVSEATLGWKHDTLSMLCLLFLQLSSCCCDMWRHRCHVTHLKSTD
jgi:hypothetical protein